MRNILVALFLLIGSSALAGDTKLVGPTSAKRGELVTIEIQTDETLIDPQLLPFSSNNAKVLSEYRLVKDIKTDNLLILLFTNTPDKYSFTLSAAVKVTDAAGKETVKTVLRNHIIEIITDNPTPQPNPTPVPNTSDFEKSVQTAFTADTSTIKADQLKALVTVMTNVKTENAAGVLDNLGKVQFSLRNNTDNLLKADSLKPVRQEITKFLVKELGQDAKTFSKAKVDATFQAIIDALNKIK